MKHLMILFGLIVFPLFANSQNYNQKEADKEIYSTMISDDLYRVSFVYANSIQSGLYVKQGDTMVKHGTWKMKIHNRLVMKIKYDMGKLLTLTTYGDEGKKIYDNNSFEIQRLKRQVLRLEDEIDQLANITLKD